MKTILISFILLFSLSAIACEIESDLCHEDSFGLARDGDVMFCETIESDVIRKRTESLDFDVI